MGASSRYNHYLQQIERGAEPEQSAYQRYLSQIESDEPAPPPKVGPLRKLGQLAVRGVAKVADHILPGDAADAMAGLRGVPFADEIVSHAAGALTRRPASEVEQQYDAVQDAITKARPIRSRVAHGAGIVATTGATLPLGMVGGSALMGAVQGADEAEGGLTNRLIGGTAGGAVGGLLGGVSSLLMKAGGAKALGLAAGGVGAASGDTPGESARNAVLGGGLAFAGGRLGSKGASKLSDVLRERFNITPLPAPAARATGELARTLQREKITPQALREAGEAAMPGDRVLHAGGPRGPLQRLARTIESRSGAGAKRLSDELAADAAINPPAAEKSVRRALGNRFTRETPLIQETKQAVQRTAGPAYQSLKGAKVSTDVLADAADAEPRIAEVWREVQQSSRRKAAAGFDDVDEVPDLFNADGSLAATEVPVLAVSKLKQALRSVVERSRNSQNPITRDDAAILNRWIGQIERQAKTEIPAYGEADRLFAETSERAVQGLTKRKQTADFVLGNSQTARIQADQGDFGLGSLKVSDLNPSNMLTRLLDSKAAQWLSRADEATADAAAPVLLAELRETAPALADAIEAYYRREMQQAGILGTVPRLGAIGAGSVAGSLFRDDRGPGR